MENWLKIRKKMTKDFFSRFWNYGQLHVKIESVICKECALLLLTAHRLQLTISFSRFFRESQLMGFYPPIFLAG